MKGSTVSRRKKGASTADSLVENALDLRLRAIEEEMDSDGIAIYGDMLYVMDDLVKQAVEGRSGRRKRSLVVLLDTGGGSIELVQRIVETLRHHYRVVRFIVPNTAMSAGTVLALSGDEILMNYYSRLGPIDPQIHRGQRLLPAVAYLEMYDDLIKKSAAGTLTIAETAFLIEKIDPAELFQIKEHLNLSSTLLKEWLVRYKFKNWKTTQRRKTTVTRAMKVQRAAEVAEKLSNPKLWHSHGRGISMDVLSRRVGLRIEDFGKRAKLSESIGDYHEPLVHYVMRRGLTGAVHAQGSFLQINW